MAVLAVYFPDVVAPTPSKKHALSEDTGPQRSTASREDNGPIILTALMFLGVIYFLLPGAPSQLTARLAGLDRWRDWLSSGSFSLGVADWVATPLPLAMQGGDPYIRALMRTISASESNMSKPYALLYGGKTVSNLSRHPDECLTIVSGPNQGDCTTAAGRYQFLNTTWERQAEKYHPAPPAWYEVWKGYSFETQYQDQVVYQWLSDQDAWNADIPKLLRDGQIKPVLKLLSGTWTSLGYGIEDNSMSAHLPTVYKKMLAEELAVSQ